MTELSIRIEGLEELEALFAGSERIVHEELDRAMQRSTQRVRADVQRGTPVDTGRLRSSITQEIQGRGAELRGVVGTNVKYAPFVEYGTRPHWPPVSALEVWARRHGTTAWAVARGIARRGTKARRMFERAFEKNVGWIKDEFDAVGERIVKRLAG